MPLSVGTKLSSTAENSVPVRGCPVYVRCVDASPRSSHMHGHPPHPPMHRLKLILTGAQVITTSPAHDTSVVTRRLVLAHHDQVNGGLLRLPGGEITIPTSSSFDPL